MTFKEFLSLLYQTGHEWMDSKAPQMGAALAFYSMLSLGPLLIIALAGASVFFGHDAAQGRIVDQIQGMVGEGSAKVIQDIIYDSSREKEAGFVATITSIAMLLFGGSAVFTHLQDAMNEIWEVKADRNFSLHRFLRYRLLSFLMVLIAGSLLLGSLLISAALAAFSDFTLSYQADIGGILHTIDFAVSFSIMFFMFFLAFKYVPDAYIASRDVMVGAMLTAFLFTLGKTAISFYLGHSSFNSTYGAAGSLVALLVWVYYSAMILFFGAKFTRIYSVRHGHLSPPKENAHRVKSEAQT